MIEITEELKRKCIYLWANRDTIPLRFPELKNKNFLDGKEIEFLKNYLKWTDRKNCCEIIGAIALNLSPDCLKCEVTDKPIRTNTPFYRHYTDEEVIHKCFSLWGNSFANCKWIWNLDTNYDQTVLERLCSEATMHRIYCCPMMIKHCYAWARQQGMDADLISTVAEAVYLWKNKIKAFPTCPFTNEKLNFHSIQYATYSSRGADIANSQFHKGKTISPEQIEKTKQTNLAKFGATTPVNLPEIRELGIQVRRQKAQERKAAKELELLLNPPLPRNEKYRKTMCERYGGPTIKAFFEKNPRSEESKQEASRKAKETFTKKYGTDNIQKLPETRAKIKQTSLEKYGHVCFLNTPEQKESRKLAKIIETYNNFKRFSDYCIPLFTLEEWQANPKQKFEWKLVATGEVYQARYWGYAPIGRFRHTSIEKSIHNLLTTWKFDFVKSDRKTIAPKELDICIPSKNIAIECNGEFFHSERRLGQHYHDEKRFDCENNNVRLFQFFGTEIQKRFKAVKTILRNELDLTSYKICASKMQLVEVSAEVAKKFHDRYNVQGFCESSNHYGLAYKGRLAQLMSFGSSNCQEKQYRKEIIRVSTIYNFEVIGGLFKLVSAIKTNFDNQPISVSIDLSYFSGSIYKNLGFALESINKPSYFYFKGDRYYPTFSEQQIQKLRLENLLGNKFDPSKTEEENMQQLKYYKIFTCSQEVWVLA